MLAIGSWDILVFSSACIYMAKANHTSSEFNQKNPIQPKKVKNVWTFYKGFSIAWYCFSEREINFSFSTQKTYTTEYKWLKLLSIFLNCYFTSFNFLYMYFFILSFYMFLFSFFCVSVFHFHTDKLKKKEAVNLGK